MSITVQRLRDQPLEVETSPLSSTDAPALIVRVVSSIVNKSIRGNADVIIHDGSFLKFQSSYAPEVSVESYLERIRKYSRCSDSCFIMALVYVDRLIEKKGLVLSRLNAHRLLITSVMLAAKYHDDFFYNNAYYAKLGGLSLQELNVLELDVLKFLDFSLFIPTESFDKYTLQLRNYQGFLESPHHSIARPRTPPYHDIPVQAVGQRALSSVPNNAAAATVRHSHSQRNSTVPVLHIPIPPLVSVPVGLCGVNPTVGGPVVNPPIGHAPQIPVGTVSTVGVSQPMTVPMSAIFGPTTSAAAVCSPPPSHAAILQRQLGSSCAQHLTFSPYMATPYYNAQHTGCVGQTVFRVPSPNRPHTQASAVHEQYFAAGSPCLLTTTNANTGVCVGQTMQQQPRPVLVPFPNQQQPYYNVGSDDASFSLGAVPKQAQCADCSGVSRPAVYGAGGNVLFAGFGGSRCYSTDSIDENGATTCSSGFSSSRDSPSPPPVRLASNQCALVRSHQPSVFHRTQKQSLGLTIGTDTPSNMSGSFCKYNPIPDDCADRNIYEDPTYESAVHHFGKNNIMGPSHAVTPRNDVHHEEQRTPLEVMNAPVGTGCSQYGQRSVLHTAQPLQLSYFHNTALNPAIHPVIHPAMEQNYMYQAADRTDPDCIQQPPLQAAALLHNMSYSQQPANCDAESKSRLAHDCARVIHANRHEPLVLSDQHLMREEPAESQQQSLMQPACNDAHHTYFGSTVQRVDIYGNAYMVN